MPECVFRGGETGTRRVVRVRFALALRGRRFAFRQIRESGIRIVLAAGR
jgi:hypothetical protein